MDMLVFRSFFCHFLDYWNIVSKWFIPNFSGFESHLRFVNALKQIMH